MIRTFIAIDISDTLRSELGRVQKAIMPSLANSKGIKCVRPEAMHLTVKFLGNIEISACSVISEYIEKAAKNIRPFDLTLSGIGVFPSWNRPSVIWAGLEEKNNFLKILSRDIEMFMETAGFVPETREFKPHITLARIKTFSKTDQLKDIVSKIRIEPVTFTVNSIILYRSDLAPQGAQYSVIDEIPVF